MRKLLLTMIILLSTLLLSPTGVKATWVPLKKGGSARQQDIIAWAWQVSPDPNWIATLEAENGTWEENRVGVSGDVGLCQMNPSSWSWWIKSPQFQDYHQQILMCAAEYAKASQAGNIGAVFHGWYNRERAKGAFTWFNN